jgi:hypothetical protein
MWRDGNKISKKTFKKLQNAVVVLIVLAIIGQLAGCGSTSSTEKASEPTVASVPPEYEVDDFTKSVCQKFREHMNEASKGILTLGEQRAQFQDIYESARFSKVEGIEEFATEALAALTKTEAAMQSENPSRDYVLKNLALYKVAIDALSQICIVIGQGNL